MALFVAGPLQVAAAKTPPKAEADVAVGAADSTRKYRYLAKTHRERKEYDAALRYYGLLLQYDPGYAAGHYFRGKMLAERKEYGKAKEALLAAIGIDSLHVNANALLCQLYLAAGKADSSQLHLNRVRGHESGKFRPLQRRVADALRRQSLTAAAISQYEDLVDTGVESDEAAELFELLATLYRDSGRAEKALAWRQRLLAHQEHKDGTRTEERIETLQKMAALQEETGSHQEALATLRQLTRLDSADSYPYYSQMAAIAERTQDAKARREALQGMAVANPRDVDSVAALAEMLLADGSVKAAEEWIDRGLALAPRHAHLQLLKGDIMARRGKDEEAIAAFEIARDDPDWRSVAQQRIWQLRPPETEEEKLKREFFGDASSKQ